MDSLTQSVVDFLMCDGACAAGVATVETLAGGPPSTDISYVLEGARSAVSFALPLDQSTIAPYLAKKDRLPYEKEASRKAFLASGMALHLANFLRQKGYDSVPVASNEVYREDSPRGALDMLPDISLRYLAVCSGVGFFGLSGNVLTKNEGAAIALGAVVTTAELEPTDPIPQEENYCDDCRLCMASCASGMMDPEEETRVTLGGTEFSYSKRLGYIRCQFVCGGFTGLHPSGKWSTWSPGRFAIPKDDDDFMPVMARAMEAYGQWPDMEGGHPHVLMEKKLYTTCGNCSLVCSPDKEERKRRYKMIAESGVMVQNSDGSVEALPPEVARERLESMSPETRALYEDF